MFGLLDKRSTVIRYKFIVAVVISLQVLHYIRDLFLRNSVEPR
jgi:hypothetical protein